MTPAGAVFASFRPSGLPATAPAADRDTDRPDAGPALAVVGAAQGFDQASFALAAVLVFPALFFPYWGDLLGTAFGLALFALGFAARPVGRWAGQRLQGRCGPRLLPAAAAGLLAASTVAIGVLPGYGSAGALAILLLASCRAGQGVAGGALRDLPRGPQGIAGALAGVAAACVLMAFIASQLVHADFLAWGWRYPFCAALAVHLVALFARMHLACGDRRA